MVTSGLLDLSGAQSFEGAHGARICAHVHRGECASVLYYVILKESSLGNKSDM
jgi:hypothetical protein